MGYSHLIWDVSDLDDPVLASEFFGATKASDHNLLRERRDRGDQRQRGLFLVKKKDQRLVP